MGIFYIIYRRNVSRGFIRGIYKGSIYAIRGTSENYIRLRPKVRSNILGSLYSKAKNPNSNFNGILPIDRWINKKTKPDVRTVFMPLCQLYTK